MHCMPTRFRGAEGYQSSQVPLLHRYIFHVSDDALSAAADGGGGVGTGQGGRLRLETFTSTQRLRLGVPRFGAFLAHLTGLVDWRIRR